MQGANIMSKREANMALLLTIPENSPFKPLSAKEIEVEFAEARACHERGEYEDFDEALDELSAKYGL
jgi:hypothetical protein